MVQGVAAEGMTVEEAAAAFGFASAEDLYGVALEGWRSLDKNGDGLICFKSFPEHQNGKPAFFSNFVDSNAKATK